MLPPLAPSCVPAAPLSLHQEEAAHRAAGPTQAPGPFPGLGLAPRLCGGWGAPWAAADSPPLDRSPGAREPPVPHGPGLGVLPGRCAGPPGGGVGPEDHGHHDRLPGLLLGLPGQEVSPGTPTSPSLILTQGP